MSWLLDILKNRIFIHQIICMKFSRYTVDCNCFITSTMETERFELLTPCLQGRCSPNWATPPWYNYLFVCILGMQWAQVDSNHRPHAYQACALTSWAMSPQWRIRDSNSWPPACKAGALPTELIPHIRLFWTYKVGLSGPYLFNLTFYKSWA